MQSGVHTHVSATEMISIVDRLFNLPSKFYRPFLSTVPLQYVPKILFTQATIDCLTNDKTKNALYYKAVILNYICGDPISYGLSN